MAFSPIQTLPRNTQGRDFIVGDLHGHFDVLDMALKEAKFDTSKDRLIACGDINGYAPGSDRVLSYLQTHWFFSVRGNHDHHISKDRPEMIFKSIENINGEYRETKPSSEILNRWLTIYEELRKLPFAIEIDSDNGPVGILHGAIPRGIDSWTEYKSKLSSAWRNTRGLFSRNPKTEQQRVIYETLWESRKYWTIDEWGIDINGHKMQPDLVPAKIPGTPIQDVWRVFVGHEGQSHRVMRQANIFYTDTCFGDPGRGGEADAYFLSLINILASDETTTRIKPEDGNPYHVIDVPAAA